jgi:predicted dehydrogenase
MIMRKINTAVIGFGLSGRVFHAPFLHVHPGFELRSIVSTSGDAKELYPEAQITQHYEDVLTDGKVELIVICTPNLLHSNQAKQAFEAGKHIVVEKPLTPTSAEASLLMKLAEQSGKRLFPYHNRRWDGDFMTLKEIIKNKTLGRLVEFESHFDRFAPVLKADNWRYTMKAGGGTLYDLGIHLIDQAVCLFGLPQAVFCRMFTQREHSVVDDSFYLKMVYGELDVTLKAGVFVKEPGPRFILHGTRGSFVKYGLDPQEEALRKGLMPGGKDWGKEDKSRWGILHTESGGLSARQKIETLPGNYMTFYNQVYEGIVHGREHDISPGQAVTNLRIIEKALESNRQQQVIPYSS